MQRIWAFNETWIQRVLHLFTILEWKHSPAEKKGRENCLYIYIWNLTIFSSQLLNSYIFLQHCHFYHKLISVVLMLQLCRQQTLTQPYAASITVERQPSLKWLSLGCQVCSEWNSLKVAPYSICLAYVGYVNVLDSWQTFKSWINITFTRGQCELAKNKSRFWRHPLRHNGVW